MVGKLAIVLVLTLPSFILSCKSKAPSTEEISCPNGFQKVPKGFKCNGANNLDCANEQSCVNSAYICDGEPSIRKAASNSRNDGLLTEDRPDENSCTDEFCAALDDGRTKRCPGTTRCIKPNTKYFPNTNIPVGAMCAEDLFSQFKPVEAYIDRGAKIKCENGDVVAVNSRQSTDVRQEVSERCLGLKEPLCGDKSDVTPETCAWACLHFWAIFKSGESSVIEAWSCPGEAKCIGRHQICDGIPDCDNGFDEYEELCTDNFCKNGFVNYDGNSFDYQTKKYSTNRTEFRTDYIFKNYRRPNMPQEDGEGNAKCKHSTKCLRRIATGTNQDDWLEC